MDYLQYMKNLWETILLQMSFKPCYKWITFNTLIKEMYRIGVFGVLNLVINGLPSIQNNKISVIIAEKEF